MLFFGPASIANFLVDLSKAIPGFGERKAATEKEIQRREEDIAFVNQLLQDQALGKGPSPAQEALWLATGRAISGASALQASARPGQQGQAARLAAGAQGKLGSEIAGQGSLLALQEQLAARQMLSDFIARLKAADVQAGGVLAGVPGAGEQILGVLSGVPGFKILKGAGIGD